MLQYFKMIVFLLKFLLKIPAIKYVRDIKS